MLPKSIEIGPISFHLYGLIIAVAIISGWILAKKRANFYKIPQKIFDDPIILIPLILAIVGARIYHVVDFWLTYKQDPISIFYISSGGLGIWGALAGSILGFITVSKIKKLDLLSILDLAAPSLILGQAIGRVGNYINQEGFGPPTNLPWGVFIEKTARPVEFINSTHFHPTFFYEAILNLIFFLVLIYLEKRSRSSGQLSSIRQAQAFGSETQARRDDPESIEGSIVSGQLFALYLIFYSTIRFIVEFWRIDTATIGQFKVAHALSALTLIFGITFFIKISESKKSH